MFYVYGNFCSFNCALAYSIDKNDNKLWEKIALMKLYLKLIGKDNVNKILPAPPKEILKSFGGTMSIEDYRKTFISIDVTYRMILPPHSLLNVIIEEVKLK
jgi:hypothetical protein